MGSGTWDLPPRTLPLPGVRDPYLGTFTLIRFSFNLQFSSVAFLFQTGSCTNLCDMTTKFGTYLKIINWHKSGQVICNKRGLCC